MNRFSIRQRGVALVLVMWLIAALTLVVVGATQWIRSDNRLNRALIDQAQQRSQAKGMVFLLMRDMEAASRAGVYSGRGLFEAEYQVGSDLFKLEARSITGLINLNRAPEELLVLLFRQALDLDSQEATAMAHRFLDWREPSELKRLQGADLGDYQAAGLTFGPRGSRFLVIEDIMQVLGVTLEDYEKLKDLVTVLPTTAFGVNPAAAPAGVLKVLSTGDERLFDQLIEIQQDASQDITGRMFELLPSEMITTTSSRDFRVDVTVLSSLGQERSFRFWVVHSPSRSQVTGVPWKVVH